MENIDTEEGIRQRDKAREYLLKKSKEELQSLNFWDKGD